MVSDLSWLCNIGVVSFPVPGEIITEIKKMELNDFHSMVSNLFIFIYYFD